MNSKLFSQAVTQLNDAYYQEAFDYIPQKKKRPWIKWSAAAACLLLCALALPSLILQEPMPKNPVPSSQDHSSVNITDITVNELENISDAARLYYDPQLYDQVVWSKEDILTYFGKDITPAYIPTGLIPSLNNNTCTIITDKSGNIVNDTLWLSFYYDYYEDGSPMITEDVSASRGFRLTASKIGLLNDCCYVLPEDEISVSSIGGCDVTFGYRSIPYGPYDPNTHAPSGYYDLYTAEFEYAGISYEIISEQLELEELVKIVASVIY